MNVLDFFSLENKVAIVTGGYGYLGKAFVQSLNEAGAKVVVAGRDEQKFKLAFPIVSNIYYCPLDISNTESIKKCFADVNKTYGSIDILVNNAVYLSGQYPEEVSDKDLAYSFDGIIGSVYKCIREVIPYMRGQKSGNIVNIASMYGVVVPDFKVYDGDCKPNFNPPQYGASKAGVIQLTKFFGEYLIGDNIRVNAISPGPFPSPSVQKNEEFVNCLAGKNPSRRIGNPEDLKGALLFLASDASKYVVGQNIQVDGGWTIW